MIFINDKIYLVDKKILLEIIMNFTEIKYY